MADPDVVEDEAAIVAFVGSVSVRTAVSGLSRIASDWTVAVTVWVLVPGGKVRLAGTPV